MERRDRRLQLVRTGQRAGEGALERARALLDLVGVPELAVLVVEQYELAGRRDARIAAGVLQQKQRVQAVRLGLVGHQRREDLPPGGSPHRTARAGSAGRSLR